MICFTFRVWTLWRACLDGQNRPSPYRLGPCRRTPRPSCGSGAFLLRTVQALPEGGVANRAFATPANHSMIFVDKSIRCVSCGEDFTFTAGEQEFYKNRGLEHEPTRCKNCREARKASRGDGFGNSSGFSGGDRGGDRGDREMHTVTCSDCGTETRVPFLPSSGRPVYCRDCYRSHKPEGMGGGGREGRVSVRSSSESHAMPLSSEGR